MAGLVVDIALVAYRFDRVPSSERQGPIFTSFVMHRIRIERS